MFQTVPLFLQMATTADGLTAMSTPKFGRFFIAYPTRHAKRIGEIE